MIDLTLRAASARTSLKEDCQSQFNIQYAVTNGDFDAGTGYRPYDRLNTHCCHDHPGAVDQLQFSPMHKSGWGPAGSVAVANDGCQHTGRSSADIQC